jgi:hypothetical protein
VTVSKQMRKAAALNVGDTADIAISAVGRD